jgi:hypothetical protein
MFSKNTPRNMRDRLVRMIGFREAESLGKCLGIPLLGCPPIKRADYQYLIGQVWLSWQHGKQNSFPLWGV